MPKQTPEQRWQNEIRERHLAFKVSPEYARLKVKGLAILRRTDQLTSEEYWHLTQRIFSSEPYLAWWRECAAAGRHFGLAPWTVEQTCLLTDFRPETPSQVSAVSWPVVSVVTESRDDVFLEYLNHHAWWLGLRVIQRFGEVESFLAYWSPIDKDPVLPDAHQPPKHLAFRLRVEYPIEYPPEARQAIARQTTETERQLLTLLGYPVRQRLGRSRKVAEDADKLKLQKAKIDDLDRSEIVDEYVYGTSLPDNTPDIPVEQYRKVSKKIDKDRHTLKKRLVDPYRADNPDEPPAST